MPRETGESIIRPVSADELGVVLDVINEAAEAYRGVIPADRWHDPYMSAEYLRNEVDSGVRFFGLEADGELVGVMGIQDVLDVTLVRHAYVRISAQRRGVGDRLLGHLLAEAHRPVLIGTWAAAYWAIAFYEKHGFRMVSTEEKDQMLKKYWSIPARQVEASVVLARSYSGPALG